MRRICVPVQCCKKQMNFFFFPLEILYIFRSLNYFRSMDDESVSSGEGDLVLVTIRVPDVNIEKCLQFQKDELIWDVKQQTLAALPKVRENFLLYFVLYLWVYTVSDNFLEKRYLLICGMHHFQLVNAFEM